MTREKAREIADALAAYLDAEKRVMQAARTPEVDPLEAVTEWRACGAAVRELMAEVR